MGPRRSPTGRSPGLNEGLPQKGKQSGIRVILISSWRSLNEGLPQKGKQYVRMLPRATLAMVPQ